MKRVILILTAILISISFLLGQVNPNYHWVNGYYRKDGTYVRGHYRTNPNNTNRDNYSTLGNINPHTGKPGWILPDNKPLRSNSSINNYNYNFTKRKSSNSSNRYSSYFEPGEKVIDYTNGKDIFNVSAIRTTDFQPNLTYFSFDQTTNEIKETEGRSRGYLLDGAYRFYDEYGTLRKYEYYSLGLKDGYAVTYDENGAKKFEENYSNGILQTLKYSTEDGYDITWNALPRTPGSLKKVFKGNNLVEIAEYQTENEVNISIYNEATGKLEMEYWEIDNQLSGPYKTYFEDGFTLKQTGQIINGKKQGLTKEYYKNGQLSFEYYLENGLLQGPFKKYHSSGLVATEGRFNHGELDGEIRRYTQFGKLESIENYERGKSNGKTYYYENGKVIISGEMKDNKEHGLWEFFYLNEDGDYYRSQYLNYNEGVLNGPFQKITGDSVLVGHYYQGKFHGDIRIYRSLLTLLTGVPMKSYSKEDLAAKGKYYLGKKDGFWEEFSFGQKLAEGQYRKGEKTGIWKYYLPKIVNMDGSVLYESELSYKTESYLNGQLNGKSTQSLALEKNMVPCPPDYKKDTCYNNKVIEFTEVAYYQNGKLHGSYYLEDSLGNVRGKGNFKNGKKNGLWIEIIDGQKNEFSYKDGELSGGYRKYYQDGKIETTGLYNDGKPSGIWYTYYPYADNLLKTKKVYSNDKIVETQFDTDQKIEYELELKGQKIYKARFFKENKAMREYYFKEFDANDVLHIEITSTFNDTIKLESFKLEADAFWLLESALIVAGQFGDYPRIRKIPNIKIIKDGKFETKKFNYKEAIESGQYLNNKKHGTWIRKLFNQGILLKTEYEEGILQNELFLDVNTQKTVSGKFKIPSTVGNYELAKIKHGKRDGKSIIYDSHGNAIEIRKYKNGILIKKQ